MFGQPVWIGSDESKRTKPKGNDDMRHPLPDATKFHHTAATYRRFTIKAFTRPEPDVMLREVEVYINDRLALQTMYLGNHRDAVKHGISEAKAYIDRKLAEHGKEG